jgi:carbon storage regulator
MLILSRRESECIHLGDDIVLTIVRVSGEKVRIGVEAPPHIKILRNELEVSKPVQPKLVSDGSTVRPSLEHIAAAVIPAQSTPLSVVRKVPIQVKRAA